MTLYKGERTPGNRIAGVQLFHWLQQQQQTGKLAEKTWRLSTDTLIYKHDVDLIQGFMTIAGPCRLQHCYLDGHIGFSMVTGLLSDTLELLDMHRMNPVYMDDIQLDELAQFSCLQSLRLHIQEDAEISGSCFLSVPLPNLSTLISPPIGWLHGHTLGDCLPRLRHLESAVPPEHVQLIFHLPMLEFARLEVYASLAEPMHGAHTATVASCSNLKVVDICAAAHQASLELVNYKPMLALSTQNVAVKCNFDLQFLQSAYDLPAGLNLSWALYGKPRSVG